MVNVNDKTFSISKECILNKLKESNFKGRCEIYDTYLEQGDKRWRRGFKYKFQCSLKENKLNYFAYIKFYLDKGTKKALVAGKSGSSNVNKSGCDLSFSEYPAKGLAKKWLYDNKLQWCKTEILVISTIAEEKEQSNREALEIEKYLVKTFGLLES